MKRMRIRFLQPPWFRSAWFYGLLLSTALLITAGAQAYQVRQAIAGEYTRLQSGLQAKPVPATRNDSLPLSAELVKATNDAVALLNLPWEEWLSLLDNESYQSVALLALEPDSAKRALTVTAEARNESEMVAFLQKLQTDPRLQRALLLHHEINTTDPNHPERFTVELTWRTAE